MKKIIYGLFVLCLPVIVYSCKGNDSKTGKNAAYHNPAPEALLKHFKDNETFPVIIDSAYMQSGIKGDTLSAADVHALTSDWKADSMSRNEPVYINDFYVIDSLHKHNQYNDWAAKLKVYEIKTIDAIALKKVKLSDSVTCLLWALECASKENDSAVHATKVFCTMVVNGQLGQTFRWGQLSLKTNPPDKSGQILHTSELSKDGHLTMEYFYREYDMDAMNCSVMHWHYEFIIDSKRVARTLARRYPIYTIGVSYK